MTIAEKSGVNNETVRTHLKKRGIKMRKKGGRSRVTLEVEKQWADLYHRGLSVSQIAEMHRIGASTVSVHLRNMGIEMQKGYEANQKVTSELVDEWVELYRDGVSTPQIAKKFGFTSTTVSKYLHERGIEISNAIDESISKEIVERHLKGESVNDLANAYSLSDTSIRNQLKKNDIAIRRKKRGYQFDEKEIADWVKRYELGEPLASIASSCGIKSAETIRKRLVARGVKIRDRISTSTASSYPEWVLVHYLQKAFPDCSVENNVSLSLDDGVVHPDIMVTGESIQNLLDDHDGAEGLIVEYDGEHWHDNPEQRRVDEAKTKRMSEAGFYVVRIIENSKGRNESSDRHRIFCTQQREGNDIGLGFAVVSLLNVLNKGDVSVDLLRDAADISKRYYAARNKAAEYEEWINLYQMGISSNEIADRYGTTSTTVTSRLKSLGIQIRHAAYSQDERNKWLELYESGMDVPDIARQEQVDKGVIYCYLGSAGISFDRSNYRPKEYDLEWKELYESGRSLSAIADKYGVSLGKVRAHLEKMGVSIKSKKRPVVTEQDIDEWAKRYKAGATFEELSKAYGIGATTIRSRLLGRGVKPRKNAYNKTPEDVLDQMVALNKAGYPSKEIAEKLGVSYSAVCRNLKSMGRESVPTHSVNEEMVTAWIAMYEGGSNLSDIAAQSGFDRNTISQHLRNRGCTLRSGGKHNSSGRVNAEMVDEWIAKYETGLTLADIADEYGVSSTAVASHLTKCGIQKRPGGKPKIITGEIEVAILREHEEGASLKKLADKYGVSTTTIRTHILKLKSAN
ncbi:HTH domain-containing protein [Adlercreutzia caecimuris]|uniref:Uncharacterized protein n=1 Tax=Adlercreutzia caecimuris B7 TaxID=1235794 RepID=R9L3B7_9ACTN|nr:HTH domain-containing protein [Adlercreutzia caecimuris]EOS52896.1 hypothetical protein C811_00179 [Adlercreutzia caecimuris B7]